MKWMNIKTDPPADGAVVIATDGKMVIAGLVKRYEKHPELDGVTGANLQTGHACMWYFDELAGWMLPPRTWELGEPTADEMFAELGYIWEGTTAESRIYEALEREDAVKVSKNHVTFYESEDSHGLEVSADLILACAQLIRELGVQKDG